MPPPRMKWGGQKPLPRPPPPPWTRHSRSCVCWPPGTPLCPVARRPAVLAVQRMGRIWRRTSAAWRGGAALPAVPSATLLGQTAYAQRTDVPTRCSDSWGGTGMWQRSDAHRPQLQTTACTSLSPTNHMPHIVDTSKRQNENSVGCSSVPK